MTDVLLVCMPFCDEYMPCMTYALFKALLEREDIRSRVRHEYLYYADWIGKEKYRRIMQVCTIGYGHDFFACETVFARAAHGHTVRTFEEYLRWMREEHLPGKVFAANQRQDTLESLELLREARERSEEYLEGAAARVMAEHPRIVAFTSMFQQHNAMIALARRLKREKNAPLILAGGPNCHGDAGTALIEEVHAIDYVFTGEADGTFAPFCRRLLEEGSVPDEELPPGVLSRTKTAADPAPVTTDLDSLPVPDFSDYYLERNALFPEFGKEYVFTAEGSRGCWWAARHPCRFCGLNGCAAHLYREKSVERFADELAEQAERYPHAQCFLTDNVLSLKHMRELPAALMRREKYRKNELRIFCEIKSSTSEEDLVRLKSGGFYWVQAGIESFSDDILKLMNKGVSAIQQVQTMKHCRAHGIAVMWYVLVGTPGETEEMCREVNRILPLIMHLDHPGTVARVMFLRHSDYTEHPDADVPPLRPDRGYDFVFPDEKFIRRTAHLFAPEDEEALAAYYDYRRMGPEYVKLYELTESWRDHPQMMLMKDKGDSISILDTRLAAVRPIHHLDGVRAALCRACRNAEKEEKLLAALGEDFSRKEIREALEELENDRILLRIGSEYLTLAVDRDAMDRSAAGPCENSENIV